MEICAAVIGAGSWGTTVAHLLAHNSSTVLWARDPDVATAITTTSVSTPATWPTSTLHPNLRATSSLAEAVAQADLVVMGVPSHGFRSTLEQVAEHLRAWVPIVSLTKGLEQGSRLRMTEVINEVLPGHPYGVLTGPNLAKEIMAGDAAASVLAMSDDTIAGELHTRFATRLFRVYTNPDIVGCEVGGALKNVMAIASGHGRRTRHRRQHARRGDHAWPGRADPARAWRWAARPSPSAAWPAWATWWPPASRRRAATATSASSSGKGRAIDEIIAEMSMVAEGVKTASVVMELAEQYGVEMPIAEQVYSVVHEGRPATEAYKGLLGRDYRHELHGLTEPLGTR